jgi:Protein of unknown function (DUF2721)
MQPDLADLQHLSQVISQATAPAFLLGAVAGFLAVLITRLGRVLDRIRALAGIAEDDAPQARLKTDLPRLERQARYMNAAIFFAVCSAICTTALVVLAFASALLGYRHEPAVAWIFILALGLMGASLFSLAREVRIALNEFDRYG